MKKKLSNLFIFSLILTTIGFIMDGDPKIPSLMMRFTEFFLMLGVVFLISSVLYFSISMVYRKFQKA